MIVQTNLLDSRILLDGKLSRQRFSKSQDRILKQEFHQDINWSKQKINDLALQLGVSGHKLYKWHWDKKCKFDKK